MRRPVFSQVDQFSSTQLAAFVALSAASSRVTGIGSGSVAAARADQDTGQPPGIAYAGHPQ
ncbi:hypothetical protein GCM10010275_23120 [Streptomyces litmocidini]|nr:hypothetical protein GCM10010275_23120 [Streptomyces litmocidini]